MATPTNESLIMKRSLRRRINEPDNGDQQPPGKATPSKRSKSKKMTKGKQEESDDGVSPYFQDPSTTSRVEKPARLGKVFYNQNAVQLSKALLGKVLCRRLPGTNIILRGTVVETEAYPGVGDAASKSSKGVPTPGNAAMFMEPGTAYVYFTYGMYYCFNVSANDTGGASLFRAVEPLQDYDEMHEFRQVKKKGTEKELPAKKRLKIHELCNGPAKLCLAFNINRDSCDKINMVESENLWLEESSDQKYFQNEFEVAESKRVGIDNTPLEARNKLYRFYIDSNSSVSKAKFKDNKS